MNHVERFRALMSFRSVDRLPRIEWATWWDKTIERWKGEGLPTSLNDTYSIHDYFGLDPYKQFWVPLRRGLPPIETHGEGHIGDEAGYDRLLPYLYPPVDALVEEMSPWGERQARGDVVTWITLDGFFWYPRTLFGIERHFYAFYDHADLMHRINQDLVDFQIDVLHRVSKVCCPVFMTFAEDMSYNHGPMLSKKLFDEFIAPYYRQVIPVIRDLGIIPIIDSDGDITDMVPWFAEVDVHGFLPLERQAGVDGDTLRSNFSELQIIGHFDKMTQPLGEEAMRAEFERLLPLMRTGGFIPSVDHQTPPGVPLENYFIFLRLLEEYTAKGAP